MRERWAAALLAAAIPVAAVPAGPALTAGVLPRAPAVTITTANVQVDLPLWKARADLKRARSAATVVVAQEMWHRNVARLIPHSWATFQPARPWKACRGNTISWRQDTWRKLASWAITLHRSTVIASGTRCASVAVLRHRQTGKILPVVGLHMIPHVEVAGHPRQLPLRLQLYRQALETARAQAARLRDRFGAALLAGDWNVDYWADRRVQYRGFPYAWLHQRWDTHWAKLARTRATHGSRAIDAIWWSEGPRQLTPLDGDTLGRTFSDHSFVRLTLRLR